MKKEQTKTAIHQNWVPERSTRSKIYVYTNNNGETGIFVYWPSRLEPNHHCNKAVYHMLLGFNRVGWKWMKLYVRDYSVDIMDIFLN